MIFFLRKKRKYTPSAINAIGGILNPNPENTAVHNLGITPNTNMAAIPIKNAVLCLRAKPRISSIWSSTSMPSLILFNVRNWSKKVAKIIPTNTNPKNPLTEEIKNIVAKNAIIANKPRLIRPRYIYPRPGNALRMNSKNLLCVLPLPMPEEDFACGFE